MREREDRYEAIGKGPRGLGGGEGGVLLLTQLRCGTAHCTFLSTNRFGSAVPWSCAENNMVRAIPEFTNVFVQF